MAEETMDRSFTSDHGDLLGAHGGLQQKWYNAFDEAIRVPMIVKGPGVASLAGGVSVPTSHIDLVPTLLGLRRHRRRSRLCRGVGPPRRGSPLPGRDLSSVITGSATFSDAPEAVYFLTEDDITSGLTQSNVISGESFESVAPPGKIESVIATLATGRGRR